VDARREALALLGVSVVVDAVEERSARAFTIATASNASAG